MSGTYNKSSAVHVSGGIWLSPQIFGLRPDGSQLINVCLQTESGEMAAMEMLSLNSEGIYYQGDKKIGTIDSPEFAQYIKKFQIVPDTILSADRSYPKSEDEMYKRVTESYAETKSIKKTAKTLKISEEKTRRILFTTGDYTCDTHEKVMDLLRKGVPLDDIASEIGLSRHKIRAYLPYG